MRYANLEGHSSSTKGNKLKQSSPLRNIPKEGVESPLRQFVTGMLLPINFLLRRWKITLGLFFILLLGLGVWYGWTVLRSLQVKAGDLANVPQAAVNFVTKKGPQLENTEGRTNVLLLGIGGEGHEGPYLTDSMMVASLDLETGDAVLISLPRDIWVTGAKAKINAVYAFARMKSPEDGLPQTRKAVEEILGIPLHYAVRVDFSGFKRAIDLIGGVEVEVARAFVDYEYPIEGREKDMCGLTEVVMTPEPEASPSVENVKNQNQLRYVDKNGVDRTNDDNLFACRYETLRFEVGKEVMDGTRALKFVRSRHGNNDEGSDFARADRQQRVIEAFKSKLLSMETVLNPSRVTSLIEEFGKSIETDIKVTDYGEFVKLAQLTQDASIKTHTVTGEGVDALLAVPPSREPYGGAYVLVPKGNDWSVVHQKVKDWIAGIEPSPSPMATIRPSASAIVR